MTVEVHFPTFPRGLPRFSLDAVDEIIFSDLTHFQGTVRTAGLTGLGKIRFPPRTTYYGFCADSVLTGPLGVVEVEDGMTFIGAFDEGKLVGPSLIKFADGSVFRGEMVTGMATGYGAIHLAQTSTDFAGTFISNIPNGFGALAVGAWRGLLGGAYDSESSIYVGDFCDGEPDGFGAVVSAFASGAQGARRYNHFVGTFYAGVRHGPGALLTSAEDLLVGTFENDKKIGLFLYVEQLKNAAELRFYVEDVCLETYAIRGVYFRRPWTLRNLLLSLQLLIPDLGNTVEAFHDFVAEFDRCLSEGVLDVRTGLKGFGASERYPIIGTILSLVTRQTVPAISRLITDCRVALPHLSNLLATHIRRALGKQVYVPHDAFMDEGRPLTPVQQDFLAQIDTLKACLLSCFDVLRLIFCFYQAQEALLLEEHTKTFMRNDPVFSIDAEPDILHSHEEEHTISLLRPLLRPSRSWYIEDYGIFTEDALQAALDRVDPIFLPPPLEQEGEVTPIGNPEQPTGGQVGSSPLIAVDTQADQMPDEEGLPISLQALPSARFNPVPASGSSQRSSLTAEASSRMASPLTRQEPASFKFSFGTEGVPAIRDLAVDIRIFDQKHARPTIAGIDAYNNELVMAFLKAVEHSATLSAFTLERFTAELFASQPYLSDYLFELYPDILRLIHLVGKPSDEALIAGALGLDTQYIGKERDFNYELFLEYLVELSSLLGVERINTMYTQATAHGSQQKMVLLETERELPLAKFLRFVVVPFGQSILKQITAVVQGSEEAQQTLAPLFAHLQQDGRTPLQALRTILSKLQTINHGDEPLAGGMSTTDLGQSLINTSIQSNLRVGMSPRNTSMGVSHNRLAGGASTLSLQARRAGTPMIRLRDPSRTFTQFEATLMGSLALSERLTAFLRGPDSLRQVYALPASVVSPHVWSLAVSSLSVLYAFSRLGKGRDDTSTLTLFKGFHAARREIFVRKYNDELLRSHDEPEANTDAFTDYSSKPETDLASPSPALAAGIRDLHIDEVVDEDGEEDGAPFSCAAAQSLLAQFSDFDIYLPTPETHGDSRSELRTESIISVHRAALPATTTHEVVLAELSERLAALPLTPLLCLATTAAHCYASRACFEDLPEESEESQNSFELPSVLEESMECSVSVEQTVKDALYSPESRRVFVREIVRCLAESSTCIHALLEGERVCE
ncbi:hypothetical protein GMRT_11273 [Giardia muris]|uniref:Vacuolar protein sorting-associated protein 8 central domain-containing protein n=1 Tax=Giardia muris TaxID=5742 RepID=A0A4Z1T2W1_GIAMU|nr:hypothetical protein GMRT_11273 [Giardia muris]|eukprot:TNJ27397.1 hypothetical protein GMRT_11273 [Giardia muris]